MHVSEWNILFDIWMRSNKPLWGSKDVHSQRHILYTYQKCARHNWKRWIRQKIVFMSLTNLPEWKHTCLSSDRLTLVLHIPQAVRFEQWILDDMAATWWRNLDYFTSGSSSKTIPVQPWYQPSSSFWLASHISIQLFFIQISIYRSSCSGCHI